MAADQYQITQIPETTSLPEPEMPEALADSSSGDASQPNATVKIAPKRKPVVPLSKRLMVLVKSFQNRVDGVLQSKTAIEKEVTPKDLAKGNDDQVKGYLHVMAWARSCITWQIIGLLVEVILVGMVFIGGMIASTRTMGLVEGKPSLRDRVESAIEQAYTPNADTLDLFMQMTLTTLQDLDYRGAPRRNLLKGIVHPDILAAADRSYSQSENGIKSSMVVQSLHINRMDVIAYDKEKVSVYVQGYIVVAMLMPPKGVSEKPVLVHYRCRAVLEPNHPSYSNPERFYLAELRERIGAKAPEWDSEQTLK